MTWIKQLTNNGTLRVCINTGNALLAQLDPISQQPRGISLALAQTLAQENDLQLEIQLVGTAKAAVQAVASSSAHIGFFAIDPERAKEVHFTRAYLSIAACYVVRTESLIKALPEVDHAGHRIVVGAGSAYDLFLSRHIQNASLVRAASTPEVMALFESGGYEVAAGLQHAMNQEIERQTQLRMVQPPFMEIPQAIGCHPSQTAEVKEGLDRFILQRIKQNFIDSQISQQQLVGVRQASA